MLGSKFVKFLMSILKRQFSSSSIFASFFIVITHNSSVNFKLIHFLLRTKGSHQSSNFYSGHPRVFWWKFAKFFMSFSQQQVSFSLNFASLFNVRKYDSSVLIWLKKYILCSKGAKSFRLSSALCQFWNDKSILLQILYPSLVSWKITPLYFS